MSDLWKNVFIVILSVFFTFLVEQYRYSEQNEILKLDVHASFEPDYLSKPKFPNANVKLSVDGSDKEKLGLYEISIVNFTSNNYKDIPIHISVKPDNPDEFKVLSYFAVGEKGMEDLVSEVKPMRFDGKSYRFSYVASTLNRAEKDEVGLALSLLFEGNKQPSLKVVANGVNTREFSWNNSPEKSKVERNAFYILIGLLVGIIIVTWIIVGPIMSVLIRPLDRKSDKKFAKSIFDAIRDENLQSQLSDQQLKEFVAQMLHSQRKATWDARTPIGKWSLGLREPRFSDYLLN